MQKVSFQLGVPLVQILGEQIQYLLSICLQVQGSVSNYFHELSEVTCEC